jgi:hypothetical protein
VPPSTAGISGRNTLLLPVYRPGDARESALPPGPRGRHRGGRAMRRIERLARTRAPAVVAAMVAVLFGTPA